jgi:two-component system osmolarity sensor histidine kinase EnvZ
MKSDVNEMQHMLEDYLAFARGDGGETAQLTGLCDLIEETIEDAQVFGCPIKFTINPRQRGLEVYVKRAALKRALTNLIANAARFGDQVAVRAWTRRGWLHIDVEDNGPGVPEEEREAVFKPFYRLDHARNQMQGHSGLGLAITRDIARSHGGDVNLDESQMGGLKATVRLPL